MKVLLVHNFYRSSAPSGEDMVFEAEKGLLEERGVGTVTHLRHNDEIGRFSLAVRAGLPLRVAWSRETYHLLRSLLASERPDVAHFHNIYYLISPSAYYACRDAGVPVVQTLHNFRMFCVNGLLLRDGKVCEDCLGRVPWRGVARGCYRGSRSASLSIALSSACHLRRTWREMVDVYIALSEFARGRFLAAGLPAGKLVVKPNFMADPPAPRYGGKGYAAYLGRLSPEKGLGTLLGAVAAMRAGGRGALRLRIVGEGPQRAQLEETVAREGLAGVEFLGFRSHREAMEVLLGSDFLVLPSQCYEGFPMALSEAFACGKPVVASRLGALAELVEDGRTGLLFEAGDSRGLAAGMARLADDPGAAAAMGRRARAVFEERYGAGLNFERLMQIYSLAMGRGG